MNFFKKPYTLRRYFEPVYNKGYISTPYEDKMLPMDIQTLSNDIITTPDGTTSVQQLKVFCDFPILVENPQKKQKADRIFFQDKWFECKSSRLSENTPLKHYTATFTELLDNDIEPVTEMEKGDGIENEPKPSAR